MLNNKAVIRWALVGVSFIIIGLIVWNTYVFFNQLKDNEQEKMAIWADAQKTVEMSEGDISTAFKILESNKTTPMLLHTVKEDVYTSRNMEEERADSPEKIAKLVKRFSSENEPLQVKNNDQVLSIIYYGNSPVINKLKYYPAALIVIMVLFFLAVYFFYKTAKSSEQNKLWAGMAKETAHQIGTPLSSLVGWTEILKGENVNADYIVEMEKDITRLEMITDRFSKIGSIPKLKKCDLVEETTLSFEYLKNRSSKLIEFKLKVPNEPISVNLNSQLFSWTVENLVKNGIDAMKGKGKIEISIEKNEKVAFVRVCDTGSGISKNKFKRIFTPGYTSKKRGWGLGLSLAKRIIEEYHEGKIRVLKSSATGTTMEIALKIEEN